MKDDEPKCEACDRPWVNHPGTTTMCKTVQVLEKSHETIMEYARDLEKRLAAANALLDRLTGECEQ